MAKNTPFTIVQQGSLTLYCQTIEGSPELERFFELLPQELTLIWLDSGRQHPKTGRWSILAYDPWLLWSALGDRIEMRTSANVHRWRENPLNALRALLRRYQGVCGVSPWQSGVGLLGYSSYELNRWIEPRLFKGCRQPESTLPEMMWFGMRVSVIVDHQRERSCILSIVDPHTSASNAHRDAIRRLEQAKDHLTQSLEGSLTINERSSQEAQGFPKEESDSHLQATLTQQDFEQMVARALEYIRAGEIFQANVSQRFTTTWHGEARRLYSVLRHVNPSPFASFLSCENLHVVSCSPERLVRVQQGCVETRPLAGTRPRGANLEEDTLKSLELLLSEKERAEHIMLVDLARNDLGRICRVGSIQVDELMALEGYSHVMHIVSNVMGTLRTDVDSVDVIRAIFPGGTITGCPKVRCMELLQTLEPVPRGLYTGSLGRIGFDGSLDLNIAIRTMIIQGACLSFHVGAGIVADSDPRREYEETLAKGEALLKALRMVKQDVVELTPARQH